MIVEDEPLAQQTLATFIGRLDGLMLVHQCYDGLEALNVLHEEKMDLIFLDVQMPEFTGLQLLKNLSPVPAVIITTAFPQHAVESYEFSVTDFLLKPFSFERFLKAVQKVMHSSSSVPSPARTSELPERDFVFLKADKAIHRVEYKEIEYLEGCGNYTKVFTAGKMILVPEKISVMERLLLPQLFIRVHRSFVVSIEKIVKVDKTTVFLPNREVPLGNVYRANLLNALSPYVLKKESDTGESQQTIL
jgi:DNA-binding LytR/AlgR family response regulator